MQRVARRVFSTEGRAAVGAGRGGPVSWPSLALMVAAGGGAVAYYNYEKQRRMKEVRDVKTMGKAALGGPWSLVNSDGVPVTDADFAGQFVLMYFGFTFCPDICPNELVKMTKIVDTLSKDSRLPLVTPIFVSLDPHRDTVGQMKAYKADFHPKMEALTGTPDQVAKAAKAFRVYFSDVDREEDDDDYLVDHSIVMYLMSPTGEFVDFYTQLMEPEEVVEKISTHMRDAGYVQPFDPVKWLKSLVQ